MIFEQHQAKFIKKFIDVPVLLGRHLNLHISVDFLALLLGRLEFNLQHLIVVALIAYESQHDLALVQVLLHHPVPGQHSYKAFDARHIIDDQYARCVTHVHLSQRVKFLLARGVPQVNTEHCVWEVGEGHLFGPEIS